MKVRLRLAVGVLALALVAGGGVAGAAPDEPEIVDPCGESLAFDGRQLRVIPEWTDICAGWFETLSEPGDDPLLRVTLEVAGEAPPGAGRAYTVWWDAGPCIVDVAAETGDTAAGARAALTWSCPDGDGSVPLPDDAWSFSGERIVWEVGFTGEAHALAELHRHGDVLEEARALASVKAETVYLRTQGCHFNPQDACWQAFGNWTIDGRPYTVGSR